MMYFFVFIWLSALYFVLTRKFTNISVLLLSCILYSVPVAWVKNEGVWPIVVWILVLAIVVAFKLLERNKSDNLQGDYTHISRFATFSNRVFNLFLIVVFFLVVVLSGGISVFFEGKYGGVPSGSVSIYYFWNSLLVITLASNILSRRFYDPLNYMCIFQVLLIFIGGDRTVPFLYLIMILRFYLDGVSPISVLTGRKLALGITLLVISPFLVSVR